MRRAAVYPRISRDDGSVQALGVKRQESDCRELAEREGCTVVGVYTDNDTSAYSGRRRPGYESMLEAVKAGEIDVIIAWHPDRLHRSPRELEAFIDVVEAHSVSVLTVRAGTLDLTTAAGRMTARVVGAVARHESEQKSERQRRKAEELALAGMVSGGGAARPYGFAADRVTVDEHEAVLIREMARRVLAGDSLRSVATWLNEAGHPTSTGGEWSTQTLRRMLLSSRIAGRRRFRGKDFGPAVWPAILDEVTWRRLGARITERGTPRGPGRRYLLTGLAYCGVCKAKLVARPKSDGRKCLVCASGVNFGGCGKIRQLTEPLDAMIVTAVAEWYDDPRVLRQRVEAPAVDEQAVLDALSAVSERRSELGESWADGDIDQASWKAALRRLDAKEAALRSELASVDPVAVTWLGRGSDLLTEWGDLHIDRQRAIVASAVERIVIGPAVKGQNFFNPDRVDPHWR